MSRKNESEKPVGKVLVRFFPPSGGVPRTFGVTVDGRRIIISPNVVRKTKLACCRKQPPYYVWLLYHYTGPTKKISLRGFALVSKATRDQIDLFLKQQGEPQQPRRQPSDQIRDRKRGSCRKGTQRRSKRPPYKDYASDKPSL